MRDRLRPCVWLLLAIALSPPAAWAQVPTARDGIEITGATYLELDDAAGVVRAEGAPVVVTRGETVVRAPRFRYDQRTRLVVAEGGVEVTDPGLELRAEVAEFRLADEWLRARGNVRLQSLRDDPTTTLQAPEAEGSLVTRRFAATGGVLLARGESQASGSRLDYDAAARVAVLTGTPQVRVKDAIMTADVVTMLLAQETVRGEGSARVRRGDLLATARRVNILVREGLAILTGSARAERGRDVIQAEHIEVALDGSKITARGSSRLVVTSP
ncbi:MAG: hypothetical protein HY355_05025 [Armatimonadetes bacterium]|nr:hypothetical protein [Armatimonadota bacterium]